MRYINRLFTYLLTYVLTYLLTYSEQSARQDYSNSLFYRTLAAVHLFVALSHVRARRKRVRLSIRLSHAGNDSKLITVRSRSFHRRQPSESSILITTFIVPTGNLLARASNDTRVG